MQDSDTKNRNNYVRKFQMLTTNSALKMLKNSSEIISKFATQNLTAGKKQVEESQMAMMSAISSLTQKR
jgi:hypothetical protein